jgi:tetratricopeptide (TPR) repeat protein
VLQALLNRLGRQRLSPILTARISLALGHLRQYAGEIQDATKCYKSAFDLAEREPRTPETRVLTARICRSMGDLVQFENYRAAQEWLERGIVALENYDSGEEAALRVVLAGVLLAQGDLDSARTEAE